MKNWITNICVFALALAAFTGLFLTLGSKPKAAEAGPTRSFAEQGQQALAPYDPATASVEALAAAFYTCETPLERAMLTKELSQRDAISREEALLAPAWAEHRRSREFQSHLIQALAGPKTQPAIAFLREIVTRPTNTIGPRSEAALALMQGKNETQIEWVKQNWPGNPASLRALLRQL